MKRRLSREEAQLWARVAQTVVPLTPARDSSPEPEPAQRAERVQTKAAAGPKSRVPRLPSGQAAVNFPPPPAAERKRPLDAHGFDSTWDRRISRGIVSPDFTLDLHGHSLDAAHARLELGLAQARAMGARVVLLITGRPRGAEAADRGQRRGAIRAKLLDWLAHGSHASAIAAVRPAHRRHGGAGAVYLVLRRPK